MMIKPVTPRTIDSAKSRISEQSSPAFESNSIQYKFAPLEKDTFSKCKK